jgi:hypothetical protein
MPSPQGRIVTRIAKHFYCSRLNYNLARGSGIESFVTVRFPVAEFEEHE